MSEEEEELVVSSLEKLARCKPYLQVLANTNSSVQKEILKTGDKDLILSICNLCLNIINGNIQLSAQSLDRLRKYKTVLRKLAYPTEARGVVRNQSGRGKKKGGKQILQKFDEGDWKRKKKYLVQKGNGAFLSTLITSALGGIIGKAVGNIVSRRGHSTHGK